MRGRPFEILQLIALQLHRGSKMHRQVSVRLAAHDHDHAYH